MKTWLILLTAIALEVTSSLLLKLAIHHPVLYAPLVAGFVVSFLLMVKLLRLGMTLGVAYGIWAASGVALTSLLSWVVYDETLTRTAMIGVVLIVLGVAMIHLGSKSSGEPGVSDQPLSVS